MKPLLATLPKQAREPTLHQETAVKLRRLLAELSKGNGETEFPACKLLQQAEQIASVDAASAPYFGPERPGQFWLTVPTGKSKIQVRLFVPQAPPSGKRPLVIALHGAGGSENMFFDAYGAGLIVELCRERGWYLCAPRNGGNLVALVDSLAELYPIDPTAVCVVGHSMGAAMAVDRVTTTPDRFAALAAISGGGRPIQRQLAGVACMVTAGSKDFGLPMSRALARNLEACTTQRHLFREYDGYEHLGIVQVCLRDVFSFFDQRLTSSK